MTEPYQRQTSIFRQEAGPLDSAMSAGLSDLDVAVLRRRLGARRYWRLVSSGRLSRVRVQSYAALPQRTPINLFAASNADRVKSLLIAPPEDVVHDRTMGFSPDLDRKPRLKEEFCTWWQAVNRLVLHT